MSTWCATRSLIQGIVILAAAESETRLKLASEIFIKQASISEVSQKIASAVDESLSKQQKEFFLRQQLAAIQRELQSLQGGSRQGDAGSGSGSELDDDEQNDADEFADLRKKIEAMEPGSEERKMGVREWRRLKRIPHGSVENGVIRNYVSFPIRSHPIPLTTIAARMANFRPMAEHDTYPSLINRSRYPGHHPHRSQVPVSGSLPTRRRPLWARKDQEEINGIPGGGPVEGNERAERKGGSRTSAGSPGTDSRGGRYRELGS